MCGIAGCLVGLSVPDPDTLGRMADAIRHRGPDDSGEWWDESAGIGLAHRRLAIIDLSPAGHQPMELGRFVIVFNGEIYNFSELRKELEKAGQEFRGDSDTEVLLALIDEHGIDKALRKCHGMFALAVWDREQRVLHLARDRFGEKPLYYGIFGDTLLFGSELGALKAHPAWHGSINRDALALYFRHNCVPQPLSIYEGVRQVRPGHIVTVRLERSAPNQRIGLLGCYCVWQACLADPHRRAR